MIVFEKRIEKAKKILKKENLDGLLVTSNSNIFYLTGLSEFPKDERDARIFITKNEIYLLTDFRYSESVVTKSPFVTLREISHAHSLSQRLSDIFAKEKIQKIGFESDSLTVRELSYLESNFTSQKFSQTENFIEQLRTLKDLEELEHIQKACNLTDDAYEFIVRHVKSGATEKSLAWEIEKFIKEHGGELAFPSIVAFGQNSAIPHYSPTDRKLSKTDEIVLLDFGAKINGYASDMTRCFFVQSPSQKIKKAYEDLLDIQKNAIKESSDYRRVTFSTSSLQKNVDTQLQKRGYPPVPHSLGHGVGIDVHESPIISSFTKQELEKNMVITIEPGIYILGKFGIRIEDTVTLKDTTIPLTKSAKNLQVYHI